MAGESITMEQVTEAIKDKSFREELRKDPNGAIEKRFGIQVPQGIDIEVLEETPTHLYMVLPLKEEEDVTGFRLPLRRFRRYWW